MTNKEEDIQATTIIVGLGCAVMLGFIVGVLMCLICSVLMKPLTESQIQKQCGRVVQEDLSEYRTIVFCSS